MTSRITASLVVCVAAAGVAVGALALDSDDPPAPAAGAPAASSAPDAGAYGTGGDAGAAGLPSGATESSRSRMIPSAGSVRALSIARALDPGM